MEWTKKRIAIAAVGGLFAIGVIGNAGEDAGTGGSPAAAPGSTSANQAAVDSAPAPVTPSLQLTVPDDRVVYRDKVTLSGKVTAENGSVQGVRVEVDGRPAPVNGGTWSKTVTLKRGENDFRVAASKGGYDEDFGSATITRKRSKAELAAAAARQRAAAAQRKQSYMANAQSIPYNQLEKNADRFAGERVKFTGQIFQIQEDSGSSVILLSVTDEGYGFWSDNIWVDYDGTINGAEDDIITVYGTIEGSQSYETQIGGETYVPQMTAKYVEE